MADPGSPGRELPQPAQARSAIPPRLVPIARELGLGELSGRTWEATAEEMARIRELSALRASQAARRRKEEREAARRERRALQAEREAQVEALRSAWLELCQGESSDEERAAWIEENREDLDGPVGREAFGIEPIASKALYFAVRAALKGIQSGRHAPAASIRIAAKLYEVEVSSVAKIVGRLGGRGRLRARKKGAAAGLKRGNEWRDVDRSPEDLGLRSGRGAR